MIEFTNSPVDGTPATDASQRAVRSFYVTGSLSRDLTLAALGGMAGAVVSYSFPIVDLGFVGSIFVYASKVLLYWGLLQVGWLYQLRWVQRGAKLLILSKLIGLLPFVITAFSASLAAWLTGILDAVGIVVAFTDLWGLRLVLERKLVAVVVLGFISEKFVAAMELLTQPHLQMLRAVDVGLLAWLFYELTAHNKAPKAAST